MLAASSSRLSDGFAVALSSLCVVHCLALPFAAASLPVLGLWAEAEWVHWAFVAAAVPTSLAAFRRRFSEPGAWLLIAPAAAGLSLLALGAAGWPAEDQETALTVAGAVLLLGAHTLNWRRSPPRAHP